MSNQTDAGQEYYTALQAKAMNAVKGIFNSPLYPVQYPSQGDFMWYYQNANQVFNGSTFEYINANISPSEFEDVIKLSTPGGFPNNYSQVVNSIIYSLSKKNQEELNSYQQKAITQQQTVVSEYQNTYGEITASQMEEARVSTKADYVISYIFGGVWSGHEAAGEKPLSYSTMAAARNLKDLLPDRPASSDKVINDVAIYLNLMSPVNGLQDKLQEGQWVIRSMKNNTTAPSEANSGMKIFDPNTGAVSENFQVGYKINYPIASIENDLANKERTIKLSLETSSASGGELNVSVEGKTGISLGSWLKFTNEVGGTYDMSTAEGTSKDSSVTITWEGYSMIPISPNAWQQDSGIGWYNGEPIRQATLNEMRDVDGFKFVGDRPPFNMSGIKDGGNFGWLTNLLIGNYPTIEITYQNADFKKFQESWSEKVTGNLSFLGFISLGSFSEGAYGSQYSEGVHNSTFTVRFSASSAVTSVPQNQRTAFVIGGAVDNPGNQGSD